MAPTAMRLAAFVLLVLPPCKVQGRLDRAQLPTASLSEHLRPVLVPDTLVDHVYEAVGCHALATVLNAGPLSLGTLEDLPPGRGNTVVAGLCFERCLTALRSVRYFAVEDATR